MPISHTRSLLLTACLAWLVPATVLGNGGHAHPTDATGAEHTPVATIPWQGEDVPQLSLFLAPRAEGFELRLDLEHFVFSPEHAGDTPGAGHGHAHLYLDGEKIARLYDPVHALPALSPGDHEVMIELVNAEHAVYEARGVPLRARLVARVAARTPDKPRFVDLDVDVAGGRVENETLRATQGDMLRLDFSVDEAMQLHLHGYDFEVTAQPATPLTLQFLADIAGRFPVAHHGAEPGQGHGHRALFYLEIYPE